MSDLGWGRGGWGLRRRWGLGWRGFDLDCRSGMGDGLIGMVAGWREGYDAKKSATVAGSWEGRVVFVG